MINLFMQAEAATESSGGFPVYFTAVYVIGFLAAVIIGSIAWYNSKRPAGWEGQDRPDWVPEVDTKQEEEKSENN